MEFCLHLNFIRECMRTDKIGSKFRFFNLQISIHVMGVAVEGK